MKTLLKLFISITLLFCFISGCTTNVPLNPQFLEEENKVVGIALADFPSAAAHKSGAAGVMDILINEALAIPLQQYLNQYDISMFSEIKSKMQPGLESMGMNVIQIDDFINVNELPETEDSNDADYTGLGEKYNIDYLLLISIRKVGTVRDYVMGIIPKGSPDAICQATGQLINLDSNEIYWEYNMDEDESVVEPERPWNTPPDYENLGIALNKAILNTINNLENTFIQ